MRIVEKIRKAGTDVFFSFEFFPPKTEAGVENLYLRMDRMTMLQPIFVDVTWGAGGCTKDLTMSICEYSQTYFGVDVLMHLTCTNLTCEELKDILKAARDVGIKNILALRGDPPKGALSWEPISGGCKNAVDLVRLIRKEHGDYFCIGIAGFPEGHPYSTPFPTPRFPQSDDSIVDTTSGNNTTISDNETQSELIYLKEKVDAGADFILTQFFYDPAVFISFKNRCTSHGIRVPIIPGMMPIQSFSSFQKMTRFCKTRVPSKVWTDLAAIKDDDEEVKAYGVQLCMEMCRTLMDAGVNGFHFYTLNLERSVMAVLKTLGVEASMATRRALPWRGSRANLKGISEDVRPINWANRPKSYIKRTVMWDEFPNGRWGDNRSPAFGELSDSHFFRPVEGSKEDRLAMWGQAPIKPEDVQETFARYVEGIIPILPWCEAQLHPETGPLCATLARMNRKGFLTINSQPAVNGERSDHPVYGWGGPGGRVYQKAYVEFFASPALTLAVFATSQKHPNINFFAVDCSGNEICSSGSFQAGDANAVYGGDSGKGGSNSSNKGVTALTWGVFPNKEILQPTIFDQDTFIVWSKEAFELWKSWAALYDDETDSSALLYEMHDTYYLVALLDNDFIESNLLNVFDSVLECSEKEASDVGADVATEWM